MFKKLTRACVNLVQKYLPDAFIFAVFLTFLTFILGIIVTKQTPLAMVVHWSNGLWSLLAFSMQMALVLVTGSALANAPAFKKGLRKLARIPKTPAQAIMFVTLISTIACWLNWGFGLIIGAIFAKELAREVKGVDYRLLIASAYSGFMVWHAGLSGSIPLTVAGGGDAVKKATAGVIANPIPTSQTLFSTYSLVAVLILLVTLPLLNKAMMPSKEETIVVDPKMLIEEPEPEEIPRDKMTPADKLENSRLISLLVAAMGFTYIFYYFATKGFNLTLDVVNGIFLFLGLILHGTPKRFIAAITDAAKGAAGIILQFPFYAGIMGMMVGANAAGASLAGEIANVFVAISTPRTFPLFTFLAGGIINFFVPSGGGQWAVQAPIMMPAAAQLGVDPAKVAMGIAWGDAWTNMIQPFWALPALAIAGLSAKDIMGYCLIDLIYAGIIICGAFYFL
ncbi:TIGR00366 family protein [Clostridium bovifaecis]|uniref:TIGR00366 family protein n=1 Tax=Clostridium bovifaecis TaxID=2184719 RepID=A0A6I6EST6_9CLOT|nr:TIGR00366 family protein [Clostridium bovifaecis]